MCESPISSTNKKTPRKVDVAARQGDPLSPLLFIAYLERVMDHVKESNCGIRLGGTLVNNLKCADDIDLIDEDY